MIQTRPVQFLHPSDPTEDRPSHSTPVPNRVRDLPFVRSRETTVSPIRAQSNVAHASAGQRNSARRYSEYSMTAATSPSEHGPLQTGAAARVAACTALVALSLGIAWQFGVVPRATELSVHGVAASGVVAVTNGVEAQSQWAHGTGASAREGCGHTGLRTEMCALASQGSFIALLNY